MQMEIECPKCNGTKKYVRNHDNTEPDYLYEEPCTDCNEDGEVVLYSADEFAKPSLLSTDGNPSGEPGDGGSVAHTTEHSPLPWSLFTFDPTSVYGSDACIYPGIESADGSSIVVYGVEEEDNEGVLGETPEQALANANLILASVNGYAALSADAARLRSERDRLREELSVASEALLATVDREIAWREAGARLLAVLDDERSNIIASGADRSDFLSAVDALRACHAFGLSTPRVERDSPETP